MTRTLIELVSRMCNAFCYIAVVASAKEFCKQLKFGLDTGSSKRTLMAYSLNEALKNATDSMRSQTTKLKMFYYSAEHISRSLFNGGFEVDGQRLLELRRFMIKLDAGLDKDEDENIIECITKMAEEEDGMMDFYLDMEIDYPNININVDDSKVIASYRRVGMKSGKVRRVHSRAALSRQVPFFTSTAPHPSGPTFSDPRRDFRKSRDFVDTFFLSFFFYTRPQRS